MILLTSIALVLLCTGCTARHATVADALPVGRIARPWTLDGAVWHGSFDAAAPALGDEAQPWRARQPAEVWLANYTHADTPAARLTVRVFAFETVERARTAFQSCRTPDAPPFEAGDEGCWTPDGVLFRWGRLVFDLFAHQPDAPPEQTVLLVGLIEQRMPPGLPETPR